MKRKSIFISSLLLMVAGLCSCTSEHKYDTVEGDPMQTRIYTLDNGLKVYLSVNHNEPRIQTYIAVRTGSKNDPAETTGLAHYLEHLMFKGTTKFGTTNPTAEAPLLDEIEQMYEEYRTLTDAEQRKQKYREIDSVSQLAAQYFIPNEYDKLMATIGAVGTNAFTSNDVTCYVEDIPANEIENWAKIQAERFQNMVIRGFHTELEAVYEEYNLYLTDDNDKRFNALYNKLFPTHPYGTQTTIGTQQHLKNPSITNIKNYFAKWYVPNNVAICMAGDFDPEQTIRVLEEYFGDWEPGEDVAQPTFPELEPLTEPVDTTVIGVEAENIWIGWRSEKASSLQNDTLELVDVLLCNGRAGLIDLDLNQSMKVMEAWSEIDAMLDYGTFILSGTPKEGQTLDEVKALLLGEIDKLKRGEFDEDLLVAAINNKKLNELRSLDKNEARAYKMMEAFITGTDWQQQVAKLDRLAAIKKQDVVDFANRFFTDGYVTVYKRQGVDTTQKKIEKPAITPIPTNRDEVSQFVEDISSAKVEPIQPVFLDFEKDLSFFNTKLGLPVIYKQNTENGLFNLQFRYEFGQEDDNRFDIAADYIDYLGTDKLTPAQVKQQFYKLACNYAISVRGDVITIGLSGLSENMGEALALLEDLLHNAKADQNAYEQMVGLILKERQDQKADQHSCFAALQYYICYGPHNAFRDNMTAQQLQETEPQTFLDLLKNIGQYEHTVLYYGPLTTTELDDCVSKAHATEQPLKPVPEGEPYKLQASMPEVVIAPYDAKNFYMSIYLNEGKQTNLDEHATIDLFNEYFGGGMNGIVFQEMREARGLAYSAGAYYRTPDKQGDPENFVAQIISQNDKLKDCITQFHAIIDDMPQSNAAFGVAKEAQIKKVASLRTTKFGVILAYLNAKKQGFDFDINKQIYADLDKLQQDDIYRFEMANIARKTGCYFILGDEKELDMKALEEIGPIRRVSLEEIFGY